MLSPESQRVMERIDNLDFVVREERINVFQIPNKQIEGIVVVTRIYGLGKVDDDYAIIDIQHVVGG